MHTLMGSYGDAWLQCAFCEKWGKCLLAAYLPDDAVSLVDVDGTGPLCDPCCDRGYPPHYDYLKGLLQARLGETPELVECIADFAYPTCYRDSMWWTTRDALDLNM